MRYVITFIISLFCFFILYVLQIDNVFMITIVGIVILLSVMYPFLRVTLWETRIDKIENFLLKNKQNPNMFIVYALANELDEEVRKRTDKLVQKNNNRSRQALYKVIEALYFKNIEAAKIEVEYLQPLSYRLYYQAAVLLEEDDITGANEIIEKISTEWMKNALLVEREKKLGHLTEAIDYANQAIQNTKGIQRYLLQKRYEREFGI